MGIIEDLEYFHDLVICPTEIVAFDLCGRPYTKLWGGCGWVGPSSECENGQWEYVCPKCGKDTENYVKHVAMKYQISGGSMALFGFNFCYFHNQHNCPCSYPGGFYK